MLSYIKSELDDVFNTFHENQVKDIIVDLRYNSGGYVSTARYLSNLIVPKILEGKKMYHLEYNNRMQQQRQQYLSNFKVHDVLGYPEYKDDGSLLTYADYDYSEKSNTFYFEKKGKFDGIRNIYFIVSKQTASASELVINNLSAYLPVKLIGKNTYGKPVGYFSIKIGNYSIYLSSFLAYNALNEGEYYNGLNVDFESNDDVSNDFGSLDDPSIKIITNLQQNNISKKLSNIKLESSKTYQYHTPIYDNNENITINDCLKLKK